MICQLHHCPPHLILARRPPSSPSLQDAETVDRLSLSDGHNHGFSIVLVRVRNMGNQY